MVVAASLRVAAEQPVAIPLSFKGFGQAYDALISSKASRPRRRLIRRHFHV
jgi:hypothetical protein